jgi:hypothetical protein
MTAIDSSIQNSSRNWLLGFGAIVVAATALTLALTGSSTDTHYKQPKVNLANDKIPDERQEEDPETWSVIELREWLAKVCLLLDRLLSSGPCEIAPPTCSLSHLLVMCQLKCRMLYKFLVFGYYQHMLNVPDGTRSSDYANASDLFSPQTMSRKRSWFDWLRHTVGTTDTSRNLVVHF